MVLVLQRVLCGEEKWSGVLTQHKNFIFRWFPPPYTIPCVHILQGTKPLNLEIDVRKLGFIRLP